MQIELIPIIDRDLGQFKASAQEAFQKGFEAHFGKTTDTILPEKDIDEALNAKGAIAYKAVINGEFVGGAVVEIDKGT